MTLEPTILDESNREDRLQTDIVTVLRRPRMGLSARKTQYERIIEPHGPDWLCRCGAISQENGVAGNFQVSVPDHLLLVTKHNERILPISRCSHRPQYAEANNRHTKRIRMAGRRKGI
jgi:hypothetical protein